MMKGGKMKTFDQRDNSKSAKAGQALTWRQLKWVCNSLSAEELERPVVLRNEDKSGENLQEIGYAYIAFAGESKEPILIGSRKKPVAILKVGEAVLLLETFPDLSGAPKDKDD
jgi:hypothetical protein